MDTVRLHKRRRFIASGCALVTTMAGAVISSVSAQSTEHLPRPDPDLFKSGDLLWPKKPGAYVPYNAGSENTAAADSKQWTAERDAYLKRYSTVQITDPILRKRLELLQSLNFREFLSVYAGGQIPGQPGVYSGGAVYVGHVGILEVAQDGTAWVIEALLKRGVVRTTYSDWLASRSDQVVWLGRLKQLPLSDRERVAAEARKQVGKRYDFWNFNLNDDAGFYCSKLVWFSIYRTLRFAVDGQPDPNRLLWLSPKQLLYAPTIDRLHDPGPYATA